MKGALDATVQLSSNACELRLPGGGRLLAGGGRRALVMGILNVTPDSFSDGGLFEGADAAIAHGEALATEGADIIDVGGESTRPGALPVPPRIQVERVLPVVRQLAKRLSVPISIDTTSSEVAREALDAGARLVNDVSALRADPDMASVVAKYRCPIALMHMIGTPRDMQENPQYRDVVAEIMAFLRSRIQAACDAGIDEDQIIVDPGFGFGKKLQHNLELLRRLHEFHALQKPVLVGTSRKAMLGQLTGAAPGERIFATAATVAAAAERGAAMIRVHDVLAAVHVVKVIAAVRGRTDT